MSQPRAKERVHPQLNIARCEQRENAPGAEVWYYENYPTYYAYAWKSSKQINHDFHHSFKSDAARTAYVDGWFAQIADKIARQAKHKVPASQTNPFKVRDILYNNWGYDQTNCDFYQVLEVKEKSIVIREIYDEAVKQDEHGMTEFLVARRDKFKEGSEPLLRRVQWYNGEPFVSMEHNSAYLWDGKPRYQSHTC